MTFQVITEQGVKDSPRIGSWWKHDNGSVYQVFALTNMGDRQEEYKPEVHYRGPDGKEWSKKLIKWYRKMRPLDEVFIEELVRLKGVSIDDDVVEQLSSLFRGMMQHQEKAHEPI